MTKLMLTVGLLTLWLASVAQAATLSWDRNSEEDMKDYQVYGCFTKGCTVERSQAMLRSNPISQPEVGTIPTFDIDLDGKEGALAVTARDTSGNESPLSVPLPFDRMAPASPTAVKLK